MPGRSRPSVSEFAFMVASLAAVAAINYTLVPSAAVFVVLLVLLAHELGHYMTARRYQLAARLPIFLPFPFLLVAATKILPTTRHFRRRIALAGPLTGMLTIFALLLGSLALRLPGSTLVFLLILFASEVLGNFFGSDGRRFRAA